MWRNSNPNIRPIKAFAREKLTKKGDFYKIMIIEIFEESYLDIWELFRAPIFPSCSTLEYYNLAMFEEKWAITRRDTTNMVPARKNGA